MTGLIFSQIYRSFRIRRCMWAWYLFSTWMIFLNHNWSYWIYLIGWEVKLSRHYDTYAIGLIKSRIVGKHYLGLTTDEIEKSVAMLSLILEGQCSKSSFNQPNFTACMSLLSYKDTNSRNLPFLICLFYINMFYFVLPFFHILS